MKFNMIRQAIAVREDRRRGCTASCGIVIRPTDQMMQSFRKGAVGTQNPCTWHGNWRWRHIQGSRAMPGSEPMVVAIRKTKGRTDGSGTAHAADQSISIQMPSGIARGQTTFQSEALPQRWRASTGLRATQKRQDRYGEQMDLELWQRWQRAAEVCKGIRNCKILKL